jgi:hypothetical protein
MFVRRQISMLLARGDVDSIQEAEGFAFRQRDVRPSTVLVIGDGKRSAQAFSLDAGESYTVQLPVDYDSAQRLCGSFVTNGIIKAVVTSAELTGTSTQLIKGSSTARGTLNFQERITSIVLSNPTASTVLIEYALYELPSDLSDADSYRSGTQTTGVL